MPHGPGDVGLTPDETKTHFGLWCMMASPLWITYDIFAPPAGIHDIVTNTEALAINQDSLGEVAVRIDGGSRSPGGLTNRLPGTCGLGAVWPNGEHLARPLANGDTAVLVFNRLATRLDITLHFQDIGDTTVSCFHVRDVWARADLGVHAGTFAAPGVPSHGSRLLRLTPANHSSNLCHGGGLAQWAGHQAFGAGDTIGLLLDCDAGTLAVYKNGARLGQAVALGMQLDTGKEVVGLKGQELCWAVSLLGKGAAVRVASKPLPAA